jgi:hypothetical protein
MIGEIAYGAMRSEIVALPTNGRYTLSREMRMLAFGFSMEPICSISTPPTMSESHGRLGYADSRSIPIPRNPIFWRIARGFEEQRRGASISGYVPPFAHPRTKKTGALDTLRICA